MVCCDLHPCPLLRAGPPASGCTVGVPLQGRALYPFATQPAEKRFCMRARLPLISRAPITALGPAAACNECSGVLSVQPLAPLNRVFSLGSAKRSEQVFRPIAIKRAHVSSFAQDGADVGTQRGRRSSVARLRCLRTPAYPCRTETSCESVGWLCTRLLRASGVQHGDDASHPQLQEGCYCMRAGPRNNASAVSDLVAARALCVH